MNRYFRVSENKYGFFNIYSHELHTPYKCVAYCNLTKYFIILQCAKLKVVTYILSCLSVIPCKQSFYNPLKSSKLDLIRKILCKIISRPRPQLCQNTHFNLIYFRKSSKCYKYPSAFLYVIYTWRVFLITNARHQTLKIINETLNYQ